MNSADDFTRRLLKDAGIGPGQRVLDIGCGAGAVTRMILERVGPSGEVVGVDTHGEALAVARANMTEAGLSNARFVETDLNALPAEIGRFDAIAGRRVLMYQRDAGAALRHLHEVLKPGGLLALQEHDSTATPVRLAALPLHERIHRLIWETVRSEGADPHVGMKLPAVLEAAGFAIGDVRAQAIVLSPTTSHPIEAIVRTMLPRMIEQGVIATDELELDGLDRRLAEERRRIGATCLWELVFGVTARKGQ